MIETNGENRRDISATRQKGQRVTPHVRMEADATHDPPRAVRIFPAAWKYVPHVSRMLSFSSSSSLHFLCCCSFLLLLRLRLFIFLSLPLPPSLPFCWTGKLFLLERQTRLPPPPPPSFIAEPFRKIPPECCRMFNTFR